MYTPVLVTPPAIKPVTRDEAKLALGIDYADHDAMIDGLIDAATAHLDGWDGILCRCLCEQTWRQDFDIFVATLANFNEGGVIGRYMRLPLYPVISIDSVKYDDENGVEQTVNAANYELLDDDEGALVRFINTYVFPAVSNEYPSVRIAYKAGYADNAGVSTAPESLKVAIKMLVGHWYENREAVMVGLRAAAVELPLAVKALVAPYRRVRL